MMNDESILCLWVALAVICQSMSGLADIVVEVRVDSLDASRVPVTTYPPCCPIGLCVCRTHLQACAFLRKEGDCDVASFVQSGDIGGLAVGRSPSLLAIQAQLSHDLALRIQLLYGPESTRQDHVLADYRLTLADLPLGPTSDQAGWATYDLNTTPGVQLSLQVKLYCAPNFYGKSCDRKCVPVTSQYLCDDVGNRVCVGKWAGEWCDQMNPCLSFPCINGGTCQLTRDSYTCACHPLFTGTNCAMALDSCDAMPCHETATCVDLVSGFTCMCPPDRTGQLCNTKLNDCRATQCQNGGTCRQSHVTSENYACACPMGFSGEFCQTKLCTHGTCQNNGTCRLTGASSFVCDCPIGFKGNSCEIMSACDSRPCQNGGKCLQDMFGNYFCQCAPLYTGKTCSEMDPCLSFPCQHGGTCVRENVSSGSYTCVCDELFMGQKCENRNRCVPNPCLNGGTCFSERGFFRCMCQPGFRGPQCQIEDVCSRLSPCHNGGTCQNTPEGSELTQDSYTVMTKYSCYCLRGFRGDHCEISSACDLNPCQNGGSCYTKGSTYICRCPRGYSGTNCQHSSPCLPNPCQNGGSCYEAASHFVCICSKGFAGNVCQVRRSIQSPCLSQPCLNGGSCIEASDSFTCLCLPEFTGRNCGHYVNDPCASRHCFNGGSCIAVSWNLSRCACSDGYLGDGCQFRDPCKRQISFADKCPSHDESCRGTHQEIAPTNLCGNNGKCQACKDSRACSPEGRNYMCMCDDGYLGSNCEMTDPCVFSVAPCGDGGRCVPLPALGTYTCRCPTGRVGHGCKIKNPCHPNPCLNNGLCSTHQHGNPQLKYRAMLTFPMHQTSLGYMCFCAPGFTGTHCDLVDNCFLTPCENGGKCVSDVTNSEIRVRCMCPNGFAGLRCERPVSCKVRPCQNNGTCIHSRGSDSSLLAAALECSCPYGFSGPFCEMRVNDCGVLPCLNGGVCQSRGRGTRSCQCKPNYTGEFCEIAFNCDVTPCLNNGICAQPIRQIDGTLTTPTATCICQSGFSGIRCEIRVMSSPCDYVQCANGGRCVMTAAGTAICKCPGAWTGPDCSSPRQTIFSENQCFGRCLNGGTCQSLPLATPPYECRCPIGYRGSHCQIRPQDPCKPNPCQNGGRCSVDIAEGGFICRCKRPYTGQRCENIAKGPCLSSPCLNMGTCVETSHRSYTCLCLNGWRGRKCQIWQGGRGLCPPDYCSNQGVCYIGPDGQSACRCKDTFGERCGYACAVLENGLRPYPEDCSLYVSCVWGFPYLMQCPRHNLHFNPSLGVCDWSKRTKCGVTSAHHGGSNRWRRKLPEQIYSGVLWRIRT